VLCKGGDYSTALAALQAGVDPNRVAGRGGFTPLHHASARGHGRVVRLLLKQVRAPGKQRLWCVAAFEQRMHAPFPAHGLTAHALAGGLGAPFRAVSGCF
jgi:ankyrin repeat protein